MPLFPEDQHYSNVNAIAARHRLIWDGSHASPAGIEGLIEKELRPEPRHERSFTHKLHRFDYLFDHTVRFKKLGRGRSKSVMAITSPYARDTDQLRSDAAEYAEDFGLAVRVGDDAYRVYHADSTIPIVFWRPDVVNL